MSATAGPHSRSFSFGTPLGTFGIYHEWNEQHDAMLLWLLLLLGGLVWWNTSGRRHTHRRYGMPYIQHSPEGSSIPLLGHGLTFWRHTPWDLLATWHRRCDGTETGALNDTKAANAVNSTSRPYHPIICFPLMGTTYFSVASPSLCKAILQSHVSHVHKDVQVTMKPFLSILGTGMVSSEGRHWLRQRMHLSQALRHDILASIPRHTLLAVQRLCRDTLDPAAAQHATNGTPVPLGSLLRHLTLQVISAAFLSLTAQESDATFAVLYLPIVDEANRRVWHPYRAYNVGTRSYWQYRNNVQRLNAYVSDLIRRRWTLRQHEQRNRTEVPPRPHDILDTVLHAYEERHESNNGTLSTMELCQIRDEMKTFMLAGHETSAAMMTWTLYELVLSQRRPKGTLDSTTPDGWMDQVTAEANRVFDNPNLVDTWSLDSAATGAGTAVIPSPERLAQLVVAEASLKESLRKYNVVPTVARRVVQDLQLEEGPYFIPKGSSILINIQSVHLNPTIWPRPMTFDPSRFLDATKEPDDEADASPSHSNVPVASPIQPFTYLPFIAGPRNCLGQHLALLESKMVIALLTQRYTFALVAPGSDAIDPEDWSQGKDPRHRFMVPIIPKDELLVTVTRK